MLNVHIFKLPGTIRHEFVSCFHGASSGPVGAKLFLFTLLLALSPACKSYKREASRSNLIREKQGSLDSLDTLKSCKFTIDKKGISVKIRPNESFLRFAVATYATDRGSLFLFKPNNDKMSRV